MPAYRGSLKVVLGDGSITSAGGAGVVVATASDGMAVGDGMAAAGGGTAAAAVVAQRRRPVVKSGWAAASRQRLLQRSPDHGALDGSGERWNRRPALRGPSSSGCSQSSPGEGLSVAAQLSLRSY